MMWVIYLAGLADGLKVFFIIAVAGICVYLMAEHQDNQYKDDEDKEAISKRWIYAVVLLSILTVITPDKRTIYLMAGLSTVEQVAQSETASKALKLVNKYLDEELDKVKK